MASTLALALASSSFALEKFELRRLFGVAARRAPTPSRRRDGVPGAPQLLRAFPIPGAAAPALAPPFRLNSSLSTTAILGVLLYPIQHSGAPIIAMTGTGPRGYPRPSALLIVNRLAGPLAREPARGARPFVPVGRGGLFVARGGPFYGAEPFDGVGVDGADDFELAAFEAGGLVAAFVVVAGEATGPVFPPPAPPPVAMLRSASAPLRDGTGYRPDCNADRNVALGPDWTPVGEDAEPGAGGVGAPAGGVPVKPPVATLT